MARYTQTVDIWGLSDTERKSLQVGQWVKAGLNGPLGRFYGSGSSDVVAWQSNAKGSKDYKGYQRALWQYGQSVRKRA